MIGLDYRKYYLYLKIIILICMTLEKEHLKFVYHINYLKSVIPIIKTRYTYYYHLIYLLYYYLLLKNQIYYR